MNVFLIWEEYPESTEYYYITNVDLDDLKLLKSVSNKFIGMNISKDEEKALVKVIQNINKSTIQKSIWSKYQVDLPYSGKLEIDLIITCGMML